MFQTTDEYKRSMNQWIGLAISDPQLHRNVSHNVALNMSREPQNKSDPFFYQRWFMYFLTNKECAYAYTKS